MTEAAQATAQSAPLIRDRMLTPLDLVTCIGLGLSVVAMNATLAFVFAEKQLLAYGALFQSDPDKWMAAFAHGNGVPTFRHPLLMLVLHPLLLGMGRLIATISPAGWDPAAVRETLVIFVAPVFSAIKITAIFLVLRVMNLSYGTSVLITLVGMASFSQVVFGSIPDHMAISGALLTMLFLQGALAIRDARFDKQWLWGIFGIAVIGVTISNAAAFATIYACVRFVRKDSVCSIIVQTGAITALLITAATLVAFSSASFFEYTGSYLSYEETRKFIHSSPALVVAQAVQFPLMLFYTLAAATPDVGHSPFYDQIGAPFATVFRFQKYALVGIVPVLLSMAALIAVIGGMWCWWRARSNFRILAVGAALILLFNWALHSVWGTGWYFYSQHWHVALIVVLAGWPLVDRPYRQVVMGALVLLLCICVFADVMALNFIFVTMDAMLASSSL